MYKKQNNCKHFCGNIVLFYMFIIFLSVIDLFTPNTHPKIINLVLEVDADPLWLFSGFRTDTQPLPIPVPVLEQT